MADFNRQVGAMVMPTTATGEPTLANLCPGQDTLCDLLKAAMNADLTPRWNTARVGTALADRAPCEMARPMEPTEEMLQTNKLKFPVIFVYPTGEPQFGQHSTKKRFMRQLWFLEYLLGPLSPDEARKLSLALRYFAAEVDQIIKVGGHPAYEMDANDVWPQQVLTNLPWSTFYEVVLDGVPISGPAMFQGSTYWGCRVRIATKEFDGRSGATPGAPHDGADFTLGGDDEGAVDVDGEPANPMVEFESTIP